MLVGSKYDDPSKYEENIAYRWGLSRAWRSTFDRMGRPDTRQISVPNLKIRSLVKPARWLHLPRVLFKLSGDWPVCPFLKASRTERCRQPAHDGSSIEDRTPSRHLERHFTPSNCSNSCEPFLRLWKIRQKAVHVGYSSLPNPLGLGFRNTPQASP